MRRHAVRFLTVSACLAALAACATAPKTISEDLTPRELFQRAQEAVVERSDYATALVYYQTFLDRYPDDLQRGVEAEYEIAFIHYKLRNTELATQQFEQLLQRYKAEGAEVLPRWPKALAEKLLGKIKAEAAG